VVVRDIPRDVSQIICHFGTCPLSELESWHLGVQDPGVFLYHLIKYMRRIAAAREPTFQCVQRFTHVIRHLTGPVCQQFQVELEGKYFIELLQNHPYTSSSY
jgi:hypothetical protein